jgi:hypothetical protein
MEDFDDFDDSFDGDEFMDDDSDFDENFEPEDSTDHGPEFEDEHMDDACDDQIPIEDAVVLGGTMMGWAYEEGLDDEAYRNVLETQAGVRSAKNLNHRGFRAVMKHFEASGFRPRPIARQPLPSNRSRMATARQIRKIYAQWATLEGCWYETGNYWKTLRGFLKKRFRVKHEKFLTLGKAGQVIEALKSIGSRIIHDGKCIVKR